MRLLRVIQSRRLKCGCFTGVYETYDGGTVEIIDERGLTCREPLHRRNATLRASSGPTRGSGPSRLDQHQGL
jgi:hypothetical protein